MTRRIQKNWERLILGLLMLVAAGCSKQPTDPVTGFEETQLLIQASTAETTISTLVVEVTAPDIVVPLVFNITINEGVASGTITVPAGPARTITIRAYDESGIETHRGSATVDIVEGTNPTVNITLLPLTGEQPIIVEMGSISVEISPDTTEVPVGETVQLTATILDAGGNPIAGDVIWATMQPAVATVDQTGLVTGMTEGDAQIVATFNGVGASAMVTVTGAPSASYVYVANRDSDSVSVIETAGNTVVATVDVPSQPMYVAVTPDGSQVYVTHRTGDVTVLETAGNTVVTTINPIPWPTGVAVRPDGAYAYVTGAGVYVIDTTTNTVAAAIGAGSTEGITISADGATAYVSVRGTPNGSVSEIDITTNTVVATGITVQDFPTYLEITPDGSQVYVSNLFSNTVSVIETAGNTVTTTIGVGGYPRGIAVMPDGSTVYVATQSGGIEQIDSTTNSVVGNISMLGTPYGAALTTDGAFLYIARFGSGDVVVIDTATNAAITNVPIGLGPHGLAITP